jgi:hypothetical protein
VPRSEPTWQQLPAIQRTVGDIESTARLDEFTASLTTSQDPRLTGPLDVLSASHPQLLPVLDVVRDSTVASVPHPARVTTAPQSRTWSPSPATVQRAIREMSSPVQRTAEVAAPVREIHPVEAGNEPAPPPDSLIEAPQPPEQRALEVVDDPAWDAGAIQPTIGDPSTEIHSADGVSVPVAAPSAATVEATEPSPSVTARDMPATPPRYLTQVQRSVGDNPPAQAGPRPIPVVRPTDSHPTGDVAHRHPVEATPHHAGEPTPGHAGEPTANHVGEPTPGHSGQPASRHSIEATPDPFDGTAAPSPSAATTPPGSALQRELESSDHIVETVTAVSSPDTPGAPPPASAARLPDRMLPVVSTPIPHHSTPTIPTIAAQRFAGPAQRPVSLPPIKQDGSTRDAVAMVQRLPNAEQQPPTRGTVGTEPRHELPALPTVQRAPEGVAPPRLPELALDTIESHPHSPRVAVPRAAEPSPIVAAAPTAGVAQRSALPLAPPEANYTTAQTPSPPVQPGASPSRTVQRASASGRLVILPPVRSSSRTEHARTDAPHPPEGSVLFESPRPMSLQRVFEHTMNHVRDTADATSSGADPTPPHEPEEGATTITFPQPPTIQREPEAAPSAPESAAVPAAPPTVVSAPPAAKPGTGDVDELVNRLYDPLAARLRAELWLDRERAGALMDLGR